MSIENFGKYQLIKRLATGGMAQIYLAHQSGPEGFQKQIVVKRILPHLAENDEFVRMFLQEARIAARLNHANVVQIFDFGAEAESYFIAMEYIHGEDVRRVWKRSEAEGQPLPVPLVCRIVMDAAAGLDYAHKRADEAGRPLNIVHRDVSPQNILVTFEGGVKVVDFGIAKAADQATVTRSGVLKGKYSYMSPEQAAGKRVDNRTDIFALGIVLYELLTGTRLFKRTNDVQTLQAVMDCKVQPPSEVDARVPRDLDPVVMKALAKNADDRYQTAVEMQLALENWLIERRLPSSSAHLANYMQSLYRDRLEREKEEGQYLIEELRPLDEGGGSEREKATPSKRGAGSRSFPRLADAGNAATTSLRPDRVSRSNASAAKRTADHRMPSRADPLPPETNPKATEIAEPGERSLPTLSSAGGGPKKVNALLIVATLIGIAIGGLGMAYALFSKGKPVDPKDVVVNTGGGNGNSAAVLARVKISSEPDGANVWVDDKPLGATPLDTSFAPGAHRLLLSKDGFKDHEETFTVPASGEFPPLAVKLQPAKDLGPEPIEDTRVQLSIRTTPDGAQVTIDGKDVGKTPVSVPMTKDSSVRVLVSLPGYHEAERQVHVGSDAEQFEAFILKKRLPNVVNANGNEDDRNRGVGTVRFVVRGDSSWAEVTCGNQKPFEVPPGDRQLAAGTYVCKFANSALNKTVTQTIEVKANQTQKVFVQF